MWARRVLTLPIAQGGVMPETIHATTMEEVAEALDSGTADEIVVEGNPQLLHLVGSLGSVHADDIDQLRYQVEQERKQKRVDTILGGVLLFILISSFSFIIWLCFSSDASCPPSTDAIPVPSLPSIPIPSLPLPQSPSLLDQIVHFSSTIIWPILLLTIVFLLFFLARRAMEREYNLQVTWTFTKVLNGKVVLSKNKQSVPKPKKKVPPVRP
jgi:hypothetical protein